MGQTILTKEQIRVLELFAKDAILSREYYLSGGTALSEYYLHHRDSDDLDFFAEKKTDAVVIEKFINELTLHFGTSPARMERIHDRRLFFLNTKNTELKLEFSFYPFQTLDTRQEKNGVQIDSLRDIRANKLAALLDRFEPKDFVDLYFLLQQSTLEEIRSDVEKKFGITVSSLTLGGELAKIRRVVILPRMRVPLTIEELKKFFTTLAKTLKRDVISL